MRLLLALWLVCTALPVLAAPTRFDTEEQSSINVYKTASPAVVTVLNQRGSGAGSFVRADGLILTNEHVVRGSRTVTIQTSQGKRYRAQVLGVDQRNDLALVQINSQERFPTVPLADSSGIQVGQQVYAIGNPFGLSGTFTRGILSRIAPNGDLQTDAALNPGNSGGPLLNSRGELIGVNKAILSPGGQGNIGIGFATNATIAQRFIEQGTAMVRNPTAAPPRLGVTLQTASLVIEAVQPGSLAEELGLQPGDRLLAINGQPLEDVQKLRIFLDSRPASAVFTVARGRQVGKVRVNF